MINRLRSPFSLLSFLFAALALSGCSGSTSNTSGGGGGTTQNGPQTSLSSSSLTFGSVNLGATSATQSVTVSNTGNATLVFASAPALADKTNFSMTTTCGTSLAAGATCAISVTFAPTAANAISTSVSFTDNSGNQTAVAHSFTVSGTGSGPFTTLSSSALTFATTNVGSTSAAQTITVTNSGNSALTIANVTLADTTNFSMTNGCGASLAANANCTISVNFKPSAAQTFSSNVRIVDNSGNGNNIAHTVTLTGVGALVNPTATLSSTSISFATTLVNTTSAASTVTVTNQGANPLLITGITLGGANPTAFTQSNNCPASLAYNTSCTITLAFAPTSAVSYAATVTLADNAANSPQTIALAGTGKVSSSISYQMYQLPDPGTGPGSGLLTALYGLVNNAKSTIDMTMYALSDTTFSGDLVAACQRGVKVRVILDQNSEKSQDTPAYNQINAQANCSAVWANKAFAVTHQKSIIVDGTTLALMSLNLQSQYYTTTRDFAMIYNDPVDIAAVQGTFNADYAAGTPASGVAGTSDYSSYTPQPGNDLIWSPTTAQVNMEKIINNATTTLIIDAEEITSTASYIATDIANACQRGVTVRVTIEDQGSSYDKQMNIMKAAGCPVHYYYSSTGFYVHAKAVIADYGLGTQSVYMGSINYSGPSLGSSSPGNRELGMFVTDQASVQILYNAMVSDYTNGYVF